MKKLLIPAFAMVMAIFLIAGCSNAKLISEEDAINLAVEELDGFTSDDVDTCTLNDQNSSQKTYDVQFKVDYLTYTVCIDAEDGTTLKITSETNEAGKTDSNNKVKDLGIQAIEKIALEKVSGANESDVYECLYWGDEDGAPYYYVTMFYDYKYYEFTIDASTGQILSQEVSDLADQD